ncbi:uncharacterized protein [Ptychodera flava]|uniref:uncharacterized protein n=1 Tax=Ptychodera flava TaxID=63121 RepID=UPI00396A8358
MRALWEIRQPRDKVEDLRQFYDTLESYIRGLESLGKVQDSYGDLLVPVIIDKIPGRIRTLITREHGDKEWRLQDLRTAILKEIHAAEAAAACKSKFRCRKCSRKHHSALCNGADHITKKPESETVTVHSKLALGDQKHPCGPVLLKTAVTTAVNGNNRIKVNVLLDEGSQRSFITDDCANLLKLQMQGTEKINLAPFGSTSNGIRAMNNTTVHLETVTGPNISVKVLIIPRISTPMRTHLTRSVLDLPHLKELNIAQRLGSEAAEIDILIGADYYWTVVGDDIRRGPGPTAMSSKFGYLLSGPTNIESTVGTSSSTTILHVMTDSKADQEIMSQYWDLETLGIKENYNADITNNGWFEKYRETHLERSSEGQYIASLPWREDHPPLPTNFEIANLRTRSMVRRLEPELRHKYDDIIMDQVAKGFISKMDNADQSKGHYLTQQLAVMKDSETTLIRIVYDCSCQKSSEQPSLNDCLETGPHLLNDLSAILLRFRAHNVGFTSDIEKAFLHVQLADKDRDYTKFLWISDPDNPESQFETYRFNVVLFGAVCSPFILNSVVKNTP